ncbi:MAG: cytochrome c3 family protein [Thermodesulfobacteriota bacterium]
MKTKNRLLISVVFVMLFFSALLTVTVQGSVVNTKHNLSMYGPGSVKALSTTQICIFCHTPHNALPSSPLWNRADPGSTYDIYGSPTVVATMGQPTGSSRLCLSCHDGTIAIGSLLTMPGKGSSPGTLGMAGVTAEGKLDPASTAYIGTDLRDDHPISFQYSLSYPSNPEIKDPATLPVELKLDKNGELQCTSCHNPHTETNPVFLTMPYGVGSPMCTACHDKLYWDTMPSVHRNAVASWNGSGQNPWHVDLGTTGYTDDNNQIHGCLACHRSHGGQAGASLQKGENPIDPLEVGEEWNCLSCHNGNVASKDIDTILGGLSSHPVKDTYGVHIPARPATVSPVREDQTNLGLSARHSECSDCHNPHAAKSGLHVGGTNVIGNTLLGSWGVKPTIWGLVGAPVTTYEIVDFTDTGPDKYESYLCLKCHSYYAYGATPPYVPSGNADGSLVLQSDPTVDFNPLNHSFHPVFNLGKNQPPPTANTNWPANGLGLTNTFMRAIDPVNYPVTHTSKITCTDCHGPSSAGDPKGPHGSDNKWILRSNETGVGTLQNFCYNCHRRDVYGDQGFTSPPFANYSRVPHPPNGATSPFYAVGPGVGNDSNKWGILCLSCHGGDTTGGTHGTNAGAGSGTDNLGERMLNGACIIGTTRATTTTLPLFWSKGLADTVCNDTSGWVSNPGANYATYDY